MASFHSPYNFIPLQPPQLLSGADAALSSVLPLQQGISGRLALRLTAHTPLLVGGERVRSEGQPTEVQPFQFPDGRYGLPGAGLQGLLRSVVEAAMGGRMQQVDDHRFALRDLASTVKVDYLDKMKQARAGFLRRRADGQHEIVPCEYAYFSHRELEAHDIRAADFGKPEAKQPRSSLAHKYGLLQQKLGGFQVDFTELTQGTGKDTRQLATGLKPGTRGQFVVSAQINDGTARSGKSHDFIFYGRRDDKPLAVTPEQWRDFLRIHDDDQPGSTRPWPGYWRAEYQKGREVPVFYLQEGSRLRFGLARMFRLAGRSSVHDAIRASHPELLGPGVDISDALFGTLGDAGKGAARGRVACLPLQAKPDVKPERLGTTVLAAPKPSYYPAYLYQNSEWQQRWTHWDSSAANTPRLRGRKRYYAKQQFALAEPPDGVSDSVKTTLHALPAGTELKGSLVLHNLALWELGALLWAIELGGHKQAFHQLGMGKPHGLGRVRLALDPEQSRLRPNDPQQPAQPMATLLDRARQKFHDFMEARQPGWAQSAPVQALLALSDPQGYRPDALDTSRYPTLKPNEFDKTAAGAGPLPLAIEAPSRVHEAYAPPSQISLGGRASRGPQALPVNEVFLFGFAENDGEGMLLHTTADADTALKVIRQGAREASYPFEPVILIGSMEMGEAGQPRLVARSTLAASRSHVPRQLKWQRQGANKPVPFEPIDVANRFRLRPEVLEPLPERVLWPDWVQSFCREQGGLFEAMLEGSISGKRCWGLALMSGEVSLVGIDDAEAKIPEFWLEFRITAGRAEEAFSARLSAAVPGARATVAKIQRHGGAALSATLLARPMIASDGESGRGWVLQVEAVELHP